MTPTFEQVQLVGEAFGQRGVALLNRVEVVGSDEDCPAYTLYAGHLWPGCVQVVFPKKQDRDPLIYIHEMAHAYHCVYFPHLTLATPPDRAEACAVLAEDLIAHLHRTLPQLDARGEAWARSAETSPVLAHALRIAQRAEVYGYQHKMVLHDLFELMLFGVFDDDGGRANEGTA